MAGFDRNQVADISRNARPTSPESAVFIAGDQPVTEDLVRKKLQSEGYSNIQIVRQGRYFDAMASKDGKSGRIRAGIEPAAAGNEFDHTIRFVLLLQ